MGEERNTTVQVIEKYGIIGKTEKIYSSAYDVEGKYIMKKYDDLKELKRNIEMIKILSDEKIPVQNIMKTLDGKEYVQVGNEYWILTTKLKGNNIVGLDKCEDFWFFNMGVILARLHKAFQKCEDKINYWDNSLLGEMESWVLENINNAKRDYLSMDDVRESINNLREVYEELPKGLIHRDVHLGNFLFYDNEFSGYIDFDLSQRNIRIFDLCYFMLGLLLEEEENRIDENRWFGSLKYLVDGYDSELTLTQMERRSIVTVMENIELLFVGFFIGEQEEEAAKESAELYYFCRRNRGRIAKNTMGKVKIIYEK